jgi:hypothetical protein
MRTGRLQQKFAVGLGLLATLLSGTAGASGTLWYTNAVAPASSRTFSEYWRNDGSVANTLTVCVTNDAFTGTNGEEFVASGKATSVNLPAGLTASLIRQNGAQLLVTLGGCAASNTSADSIVNLGFLFQNSAFTGGVASAVTNYNESDLSVTYLSQNPANLYVATTGSDSTGDGSAGNPFATVAKALTYAQSAANDVIHLAPGTYTENNIQPGSKIVTLAGSSSANTILQAAAAAFTTNQRILVLTASAEVRNLTLRHGNSTGSGGGVYASPGEFYFDGCLFASNATTVAGGYDGGGAIGDRSNGSGLLNIRNCQFVGNRSAYDGGAVWSYTPAIWTSNCTFTANTAGNGGAVMKADNQGGSIALYDSLFSGNAATNGSGGGAYSIIPLTVRGCTFVNNSASANGGAVRQRNGGTYVQCTAVGNSAANGGAIYESNPGTPALYGCTLYQNSASAAGGGVYSPFGGGFTLVSCVVASNTAPTGPDICRQSGGAASSTRSLVAAGDGSGLAAGNPDGNGNYVGTSAAPIGAGVLPLADRGGRAPSCALLAVSPAVDHGTNAMALAYDVRGAGYARLVGAQCDMGAFEYRAGPTSLVCSATTFYEAAANNGGIDNTTPLAVSILNDTDTFTGSNGDDFVAQGKVLPGNLPAGLTAVVTRAGSGLAQVTLTGRALSNSVADNVSNIILSFQNGAFTGGDTSRIANATCAGLSISFLDPGAAPRLSYGSSTFTEAAANDGSIGNALTIMLTNDVFTGGTGDNFVPGKVSVANVPAGLTAQVIRTGPLTVQASLAGNAASHNAANNVGNLTITFLDSAFSGGNAALVTNAVKADIAVQFLDPVITYGGTTFVEGWQNDGRIGNSLAIALAGDQFTSSAGEDLIAAGKVQVQHLPAGLTAQIICTGSRALTASLQGNALAHATSDTVGNLTFTFQNSAFAGAPASAVTNFNRSDLMVSFLPVNPSNWYVSVTGNDTTGDGSAGNPFATVARAHAAAQASANDVIHLLPGIFTENGITISKLVTITGHTSADTILQAAPAPYTTNANLLTYTQVGILRDLTLRHGYGVARGGAVNVFSATDFYCDRCLFASNGSVSAAQFDGGGAIDCGANYGNSTSYFQNCQFVGNRTAGHGGAIRAWTPSLWISNCTFAANAAAGLYYGGGALCCNSSTPQVRDSSFSGNAATNAGGAVYAAAPASFLGCAFADNATPAQGGAVYAMSALLLVDCTASGNRAQEGGAIYDSSNSGVVSLYNSTLCRNSAATGGAIRVTYQGYDLYSTIAASNAASAGPDIYWVMGDRGCWNSIVGDNTSSGLAPGAPDASSNYIGTAAATIDPGLAPLAENGGPTPTCALLPESPAVDHGSNPLGLTWDQRGVRYARSYSPRPLTACPDIGAFELGAGPRPAGSLVLLR